MLALRAFERGVRRRTPLVFRSLSDFPKTKNSAGEAVTQQRVFRSREEAENADLVSRMNQLHLEEQMEKAFITQETLDLSKSIRNRFQARGDGHGKRFTHDVLQRALQDADPFHALTQLGMDASKAAIVTKHLSVPTRYPVER